MGVWLIFFKIPKKTSYTIYDMLEVNLLQFYYLKMNRHNPKINMIKYKLNLINNLRDLNNFIKIKDKYLFIANWSISEFPYRFRKNFILAIKNAKFSIISFQENFEKINNEKFFYNFLKQLGNKYVYKIEPFKFYNKALFNNNKHFILTIEKNE